jgi:RNA polymerase II subunit A-like phosphatase
MWILTAAQHAEKTQQELIDRLLREERLYLILDLDQTILHATDQPINVEDYAAPHEIHHFTMNEGNQSWHVKVRR